MTEIDVRPDAGGLAFDVVLRDQEGETRHRVTASSAALMQIKGTRALSPEDAIRACFRFLLARESKESILSRFDVSVIPNYFPEFEHEIGKY